jgi:hypothetical protein
MRPQGRPAVTGSGRRTLPPARPEDLARALSLPATASHRALPDAVRAAEVAAELLALLPPAPPQPQPPVGGAAAGRVLRGALVAGRAAADERPTARAAPPVHSPVCVVPRGPDLPLTCPPSRQALLEGALPFGAPVPPVQERGSALAAVVPLSEEAAEKAVMTALRGQGKGRRARRGTRRRAGRRWAVWRRPEWRGACCGASVSWRSSRSWRQEVAAALTVRGRAGTRGSCWLATRIRARPRTVTPSQPLARCAAQLNSTKGALPPATTTAAATGRGARQRLGQCARATPRAAAATVAQPLPGGSAATPAVAGGAGGGAAGRGPGRRTGALGLVRLVGRLRGRLRGHAGPRPGAAPRVMWRAATCRYVVWSEACSPVRGRRSAPRAPGVARRRTQALRRRTQALRRGEG